MITDTANPSFFTTKTPETIILLHGLWMKGGYLYLLAKRLRVQGYRTICFNYRSLQDTPSETVTCLNQFIMGLEAEVIHFVGHSLGGLLVQHLLTLYPQQRPGRVVALGSPFNGSIVAQRLYAHPLGRYLLGKSIKEDLLIKSLPTWEFTQALGVIAGIRGLGIGRLIVHLPPPHDGIVRVTETKLSGMHDHCLVNTHHNGLPFSSTVVQRIITFLRHGYFTR
ncbi:lipase [Candidatus Nitrosoglobus terrae]|uniref:Lipase n=1 Tax=Candidatus Nitrosoglobus terrae TaxID=1630141 RepID=A0A1Q2SMJ1_9GAMM|nr:alpha/beta fold hydrolase [Candidatus Nitrosoglobus terrae]BAW80327.1 lipase [Candidatus Nitrosoglobus terrae]